MVVGSGLASAAVALELAHRGRRVVVLGGANEEGATHDLGLVACGPACPYARAVRLVGREGAISLWSAGRENHARIRALVQPTRRDLGYRARGGFLLAQDRAEAESLAESEDLLRDDGFPGEFLDHYMLETRFDVSGFAAAYWAAEDAEVDAALLLRAAAAAAREAGASWSPGSVHEIEIGRSGVRAHTPAGPVRAERAVVASEGLVSAILPEMSQRLRVVAVDGRRFKPVRGATLPFGARTANGRFAWQEDAGGVTLVSTGAVADPGLGPTLDDLLARLHAAPATERSWSEPGERTPDGRPLVGLWPDGPLAVVCGLGPWAASLAFAAARWIADAFTTGVDPTPAPLQAARSFTAGPEDAGPAR
jgi:glycine/D-amino acid oxidase-like deaminating enzyme